MNVLELFALGAIWGASFLFMRIGAPEFGPVPLIAVRVAIGALILLPVLRQAGALKQIRQYAWPLCIVGVANSAIPFSLFAFSTLSMGAGFSSILNATTPLWGALIGYTWKSIPLTRAQAWGLLLGIIGVVLLVWGKLAVSTQNMWPAITASLCAAALYGFAANYLKHSIVGVPSRVVAFGSQFFAALVLLPFALFLWPTEPISYKAWLSVLTLGVLCTGIAYIFYFRLVGRAGPAYAMSVTFLVPVFGTLWSACFLGEQVTLSMFFDSLVIFAGIALTSGKLKFALSRAKARL